MRFQTPLVLIASLITFVSGEAAGVRSHARDLSIERDTPDLSIEEESHLLKRNPVLPKGKDDTKLHAWIRTDKETVEYDNRHGISHEGLNQMMKDIGGNHVDVVVGNSKGYYQAGLEFSSKDWIKQHPNGDGAAISEYWEPYVTMPQESFQYQGQIDGRKTLNSVHDAATQEIKDHTYNHQTYNCKTYAQNLVKRLNVKA
ncbi:uncharacterized protein F4807DRAFT_78661 [Annulohypoxylon truncatum]|uniref:uncharacterized protein n=1 Tax=Annulohypoxylon truncatum TaxID=327061 RepID=UPI0020085906|nr:uncharacterized protein F4807DRAFT_78661 [Annulohypoxylon truncatum]KAI1209931.1 hypothetical protein F4807DRAFT_78661 [Annulohypoxylon truncatum]